jgi:hypothetical protein
VTPGGWDAYEGRGAAAGRDQYGRDQYGRDQYGRDPSVVSAPPTGSQARAASPGTGPYPPERATAPVPPRSAPRQTSPVPVTPVDPRLAHTASWAPPAGEETNPLPPAPRQPIVPPAQRPRTEGTIGADQIMREREQRARAGAEADEAPAVDETDRPRPGGVR